MGTYNQVYKHLHLGPKFWTCPLFCQPLSSQTELGLRGGSILNRHSRSSRIVKLFQDLPGFFEWFGEILGML